MTPVGVPARATDPTADAAAHPLLSSLGRESFKTSSSTLAATHYRYDGDIKMDQCSNDRGRWVKMSFKGSDDSAIEHVLQE